MNKKYLKTKEGSIEDAVLGALRVETPENPNSYRPTLTLPKNKYLETREGSLERAVEKAMVTEAGASKKQVRMAKGIANDPRHKGGDMTGAWKKAEKIKKGLGDHPKVAAALRKANQDTEPLSIEDTVSQVMERGEYNVPPLKDKTTQASPKRSVSADNAPQTVMDTINKIAKSAKPQMVHGHKIDGVTAIAIQKVLKALNSENAKKMEEAMNKDAEGLMGMAKFSLDQIK